MKHVVILGNGIAGITAARYIRKRSDDRITVISAESPYFFSRTALMYVYMGHMRQQDIQPYAPHFWEKNRIGLLQAWVTRIDTENRRLLLSHGKDVVYDTLILATGSVFNKFGWPGQDLEGVGGLYSLQDLEYVERYSADTQQAVIVGGGLIGIELAEMFLSRGIHVHFLVREPSYWNGVLPPEESEMVNRHIREHHVHLHLNTELAEILPGPGGRVRAVRTGAGQEIPCQFVGLTAGVRPNLMCLEGSGIETGRGILVNDLLETSVPGVYAIGDCAELRQPGPGRKALEQIWYTGKMMGEAVAHTVTGDPRPYRPRLWFNSAKFFDIEYQIYGDVPPVLPASQDTVYWEHPEGRMAIRINWDRETDRVLGFHLMGIRYRHTVCERMILEGWTMPRVMGHLAACNFDPEFFTRYEAQVVARWEQQTGKRAAPASGKDISALIHA